MSKRNRHDMTRYRVSQTRRLGEIKQFEKPVVLISGKLYAAVDPEKGIQEDAALEHINMIGIQFQVSGEKKEWLTVPLPGVFGNIIKDLIESMAMAAVDDVIFADDEDQLYGNEYDDDMEADFEDEDQLYGNEFDDDMEADFEDGEDDDIYDEYFDDEFAGVWNDYTCGISAIAGIAIGNLSQYILEIYGKYMTTENVSEHINTLSHMILDTLEQAVKPLVDEMVNDIMKDEEEQKNPEGKAAQVIDITTKLKK